MQLHHHFELPLPLHDTWELINRIEEITPCLPGASAKRTADQRYETLIKIRFGPLDLAFRGQLEVVEHDEAAHRLVVRSKANDAKGQGSASGTTTITMDQKEDLTRVDLTTELMIGGRIAQMGRGMVGDVSNELLARFVANLKAKFLADAPAQAAQVVPTGTAGPDAPAPDAQTEQAGQEHHATPITAQATSPTLPTTGRTEAVAGQDYVDVGGAVRRAFWRRLVSFFFFWKRTG